MTKHTPLGVMIIAVLAAIAGILDIIVGITYILGSPLLIIEPLFIFGALIIGLIILIWGIIMMLAAISLYRMESWAWLFVMIITIINLIFGIFSGAIWTIILSIIIVAYLYIRKDEFKK